MRISIERVDTRDNPMAQSLCTDIVHHLSTSEESYPLLSA